MSALALFLLLHPLIHRMSKQYRCFAFLNFWFFTIKVHICWSFYDHKVIYEFIASSTCSLVFVHCGKVGGEPLGTVCQILTNKMQRPGWNMENFDIGLESFVLFINTIHRYTYMSSKHYEELLTLFLTFHNHKKIKMIFLKTS